MKAPLPPDEEERLRALYRLKILDTLPEQAFDDITRLASLICGTPVAVIALIDRERQWFKSQRGLNHRQTHRDLAFCAHAILERHTLIVPDARQDRRFADNELVLGDPHIQFYAGAPLRTEDGYALGTLCVIDFQPRQLSAEQIEALEALSRQTMAQIRLSSANQRWQFAEQGSMDGFWEWFDIGQQDWWWSPRCYEMLGLDSGSQEPSTDLVQTLIHPDDLTPIDRCLRASELRFEVDLRLRTHGDYRWFRVRGLIDRDRLGRPLRVAGSLTDVHHARRAAEELRAATLAAEEASRAKSEFLASMSHELRTPLNAIIGFSEVLQDQTFGELSSRQLRYLGNIVKSGHHLLGIVSDVLDLCKIEAGKLNLVLQPIDVQEALQDALGQSRTLAQRKRQQLAMPRSDELWVWADSGRLRQILFNLLSNAVKFTPEGGRIEVSFARGDGCAMVCVRDTGIGIAPALQQRIFREFEQVDSGYARAQEGTGLGLALTRRLVEAQGGRIWLESSGVDGEGCAFFFSLPATDQRPGPPVGLPDFEPVPARGRILVVEDDPASRELLEHYLIDAGYRTACASDGMEALRLIQDTRPDAVTLDLELPGMDGWQVLAAMRQHTATKAIPVLVISSQEPESQERSQALGVFRHLAKPVGRQTLLELVSEMLS